MNNNLKWTLLILRLSVFYELRICDENSVELNFFINVLFRNRIYSGETLFYLQRDG